MRSNLDQEVNDVISNWVNKGYMFSAFDVTKHLRNQGVSSAHWEVRDFVRNSFSNLFMGSYMRTLINVGSDSTFIYHSPNSDPAKYMTDWFTNDPTQDNMIPKISTVTPIVNSVVTKNTTKVTDIVQLTNEGRLNVGSKYLSQIGANVLHAVSVSKDNGKIAITPYVAGKNGIVHPNRLYLVNQDNRVRLSYDALNELLDGSVSYCSSFKFDVQSGKILIEKV